MSIIARPCSVVKLSPEDIAPDHGDEPHMGYTPADRDWAAVALNERSTDYDVIEDEWPGTLEELNRWFDSLAPTDEEIEQLARCEAFLGHDA
jgi:hypothetical protein